MKLFSALKYLPVTLKIISLNNKDTRDNGFGILIAFYIFKELQIK